MQRAPRPIRQAAALSPPPVDEAKEHEREAKRKADEEAQRLQSLKHHALTCIPYGIPAKWRPGVIEHLERYVTPERVPPWLPHHEQLSVVRGLVDVAVKPYRTEVDREVAQKHAKEQAEGRIQALIEHGVRYANHETKDWDIGSKYPARREVEEMLKAEVKADWTEEDVEDAVDEVLEELEEEAEDE
ncbi:MAG: hypothetical protein V3S83_05615 [Gemmatimonadota bacterium]